MSLKGGSQLRARLRALAIASKPIRRAWADTTAEVARQRVAVNSGKTRRTFKVRVTQRKAMVVGSFVAYFIDAGPKRHTITNKKAGHLIFQASGRTIFTKRVNHPGYRGRPFRAAAAHEGLRRHPLAQSVIDAWNEAA